MSQDATTPTVEEHPNTKAVLRISIIAAFGGFLFGYDSAVINGAVGAIREEFGVDPASLGFAVASALLGAAAGAFSGGRVADALGRVPVMKIAAVLFLISAIGCGVVDSFGWLIFWRIVGGVGVGIASVIAPAYIAEVAPAAVRGRLGSLQQMGIVLGIFISLAVDAWLAGMAGGSTQELWLGLEAWRWMFMAEAIPALAYLIGAFTIPESPRYLVEDGRADEAQAVLASLQGSASATERVRLIKESLRSEHKPRLADLKGRTAGLKPIVWVGIGLAALQQFVGINVIFYYSTVLWQAVGFTESNSFTITVITSVVNVAVTIVAIALVEKVGRRRLLLVGSAGMTLMLGTLAVVFATADVVNGQPDLGPTSGPIALVAANLFVVFFGVSWGPMMWVLLGEMFPNRIRGAALAVAGFVQWIANWIVTVTFPALAAFSLGVAYGLYAFFALISLIFTVKMVRETTGIELEDMQD
ncbi:sugar porter family MFS transporter [Kocuria sabuli]|uniref:sugar porter family MFS transporter n=1 Tax=Kocuria sabuli TaxID=3071448 RepID=UPI0034D5B8C4